MRYQRFQVTYVLDIRDFRIHIRYQRFQVAYKISEIS